MNERLLKLLESEQLSSSKFADVIGVQRSSVSHILSGRNKPSYDFLHKILKTFPMISADWLLIGEGGMYKGEEIMSGGNLFDQPQVKSYASGSKPGDNLGNENDREKENIDDISPSEFNISGETDTAREILSPKEVHNFDDKPPQKKQSEKSVKKVIIFYSDNTFESYSEST